VGFSCTGLIISVLSTLFSRLNSAPSLNIHLQTLSRNTPQPRASDIIRPTYILDNEAEHLRDQDNYRFVSWGILLPCSMMVEVMGGDS
jgi:hypothetical protein